MSATEKKIETVTIKGTAGGLLIRVRDDVPGTFNERLEELDERLQAGEKFFRRGRASVELGERVLEQPDLEALQESLKKYEIELAEIISGSQVTRSLAKEAGLVYKLPNSQNTRPVAPRLDGSGAEAPAQPELAVSNTKPGLPFDSAEALFLRRTLRSGQIIRHHSDVVVLGDVNPGAEIIAGGSVIVWGTLRGRVQAGSIAGGPEAVICALSLKPTQLVIGKVVAVGSSEKHQDQDWGAEIASVQDGTIIIESWNPRPPRRSKF